MPTDAKGGYKILGIEEGWYTLGVSAADRRFQPELRRLYQGRGDGQALGRDAARGGCSKAKVEAAAGIRASSRQPGGILLIVALVGAAGFGVYELTKSETEVSPIR